MKNQSRPKLTTHGNAAGTAESEQKWTPGTPGAWAIARFQAGGWWQGAALLYWITWRWRKKNKITRWNREWIVASADQWATEAGLSPGEYKNKALPALKKRGIITVKSWKIGGKRATWISLNEDALETTYDLPYEFHEIRRKNDFYEGGIISANSRNYIRKKRKGFPRSAKSEYDKLLDKPFDDDEE